MPGKLLRLPQRLHAFGFFALLIQDPCSIERGACLTRVRRRSGFGRRCLRSGCFAHRRGWRMLTRGHRRHLALGGLAHGRGRRMLGRRAACSLLRRSRLARGLPARIFGTRSTATPFLAGKTAYLETTAASAGTPGQGVIYWAEDGTALYKTPTEIHILTASTDTNPGHSGELSPNLGDGRGQAAAA